MSDKTMQHTPGPWKYEQSTKTIRSMPANYWLATMDSWEGAVDHEANARLIAASPELLEALKEITFFAYKLAMNSPTLNPEADYIIPRAHAAIAKAEGK